MSRNAIVYASRSRMTGALALTIDTRHPDVKDGKLPFKGPMVDGKFPDKSLKEIVLRKRTKAEEQMRYAAYDVDHNVTAYFAEHYPAGRAIAHTEEFCTKCKALAEKGERIAKPSTTRTPAPVASKPSSNGNGSKRTSSRSDNNARRRQANAQHKPSTVTSNMGDVRDAVRNVSQSQEASETPAETSPEPVAAATE